jgi:hypothetical protein
MASRRTNGTRDQLVPPRSDQEAKTPSASRLCFCWSSRAARGGTHTPDVRLAHPWRNT